MYATALLNAMLGEVTDGALPEPLKPADRIMQRWDTAHRGGYPIDEDKDPISRPPALDDDTAMVVDDIINHDTPPASRKILVAWYRSDLPTYKLADKLGVTPRSLTKQHQLALHFLKFRFECSNNLTLLRLLRVRF